MIQQMTADYDRVARDLESTQMMLREEKKSAAGTHYDIDFARDNLRSAEKDSKAWRDSYHEAIQETLRLNYELGLYGTQANVPDQLKIDLAEAEQVVLNLKREIKRLKGATSEPVIEAGSEEVRKERDRQIAEQTVQLSTQTRRISELEESLGNADRNTVNQRSRLSQLEASLAVTKDEKVELANSNSQLPKQLEEAKNQVKTREDRVSQLESELKTANDDKATQATRNVELENLLEGASKKAASQETEIGKVNAQLGTANGELSKMSRDNTEQQAEHQVAINELNDKIKEITNGACENVAIIDGLRSTVTDKANELQQATHAFRWWKEEARRLKAGWEFVDSEALRLKAGWEFADSEARRLKAGWESANNDTHRLKAGWESATNEAHRLKAERESATNEGKNIQAHLQQAQLYIRQKETEILGQKAEIEELKKNRMESNQSTAARLRQQIETKDATMTALKNELSGSKAAIKALQTKFKEYLEIEVNKRLQADKK